MVSDAERAHFQRSGWLCRRGFFDAPANACVRSAIDTLGAAAAESLRVGIEAAPEGVSVEAQAFPRLIVVPELDDPRCVCRYEYILASHRELRESLLRALTPLINALGGEAFIPFKDKLNNKHPGGGAYRPHQDIVAYRAFGPRYHLTAMVTIDASTLENGCLWMAEDFRAFTQQHPQAIAEHLEGRPVLHSHEGGALHGDIHSDIAEQMTWLPLETHPGDLVVFDSFVPHRSELNQSTASRRALFVTFSTVREADWYERYYDEKRRHPMDPKFHVSTPTRHALSR